MCVFVCVVRACVHVCVCKLSLVKSKHVFGFVADDACESNPCANKGTCTITQKGLPGYRCACRTGYIGLTCTGMDVLRTNIDNALMHACTRFVL